MPLPSLLFSLSLLGGITSVWGQLCNLTSDDLIVDWGNVFRNGTSSEFNSISMSQSQGLDSNGAITITVSVTADYKVVSTYESLIGDNTQYGFTYILDSYMFEDSGRLIAETNPCENRLQASFDNVATYSEYWTYSLNADKIGNDTFGLEYPDPNIWTLTNDGCSSVTYSHEFTFSELSNDCGFTWTDAGDSFELKGEFYLTGVSPNPLLYSIAANSNDNGNYLTTSLISEEITISFEKSITIVSDANVDLFGAYTLSVDYNELSDLFEITILTYVPNYMSLDDNGANKQITVTNSIITETSVIYTINEDSANYGNNNNGNGSCLLNDDYRCWQKFIITVNLTECPDNTVISIDGDYTFLTEFKCIGDQAACDNYYNLSSNDLESNIITLDSIALNYNEDCDDHTKYDITFDGTLEFYTDDTFTNVKTGDFDSNGETVYGKVSLDDSISGYSVLGMQISAITLCTADVSDDSDISSCIDASVDASLFYDVISDAATNYNLLNSDTTDGSEEFSFTLPVLADDRFFVDVMVEITLNNNGRRRMARTRLLLADDDTSDDSSVNAITNFMASGAITTSATTDDSDTDTTTDDDDDSTVIISSNDDSDNDGDNDGSTFYEYKDMIEEQTVTLSMSIIGGCCIIAIAIAVGIIYSAKLANKSRMAVYSSANGGNGYYDNSNNRIISKMEQFKNDIEMQMRMNLNAMNNNNNNNNNHNNHYGNNGNNAQYNYQPTRSRTASVGSSVGIGNAYIPSNEMIQASMNSTASHTNSYNNGNNHNNTINAVAQAITHHRVGAGAGGGNANQMNVNMSNGHSYTHGNGSSRHLNAVQIMPPIMSPQDPVMDAAVNMSGMGGNIDDNVIVYANDQHQTQL